MIRRIIHGSSLGLLGLALATGAAGCGDPNESEFRDGSGNQVGKADPKYAHGTPDSYKAFYEDNQKKLKESKGQKSAPKGAPAPAEKKE